MLRSIHILVALMLCAIPSRAFAQQADATKEQDEEQSCVRPGTEQIAKYVLSNGSSLAKAINTRLTPLEGNRLNGRDLMVRADRGNCTTCHAVADIRKKARTADSSSVTRFGIQGTVGPALDGVAAKYTEGELRLLVVNPQIALPNANSIMPAYHHAAGRTRVKKECEGRAILTAQEVEDVVAYLMTLKEKKQ